MMGWPAFLTRHLVRFRLRWELNRALARRKAGRPELRRRARKGAGTKVHQAYQNDALLHGRVQL